METKETAPTEEMTIEVNPAILRRAMVCKYPSGDRMRKNLAGLLFTTDGRVVATDGHVLYEAKADFTTKEDTIIELLGNIPAKARACKIVIGKTYGRVEFYKEFNEPLTPILCRTIQGTFPDYLKVMGETFHPTKPHAGIQRLTLGAKAIAKSVKVFGDCFTLRFGENDLAPILVLDESRLFNDRMVVMPAVGDR
jgi:hypothetical protein